MSGRSTPANSLFRDFLPESPSPLPQEGVLTLRAQCLGDEGSQSAVGLAGDQDRSLDSSRSLALLSEWARMESTGFGVGHTWCHLSLSHSLHFVTVAEGGILQ